MIGSQNIGSCGLGLFLLVLLVLPLLLPVTCSTNYCCHYCSSMLLVSRLPGVTAAVPVADAPGGLPALYHSKTME
jgi:hypothetical protein